ncbi:MAG: hypothetical protein ACYC5M_14375 [Anaerolineae bacterium]
MLALAFATLFAAGFALTVRFAQLRRANLWAVGAINYASAALFHIAHRALEGEGFQPSAPTLTLGALTGLIYVGSYFVLFAIMRLRGLSISAAVEQLGVLVPVLASLVLWGERPSTPQAVGSLLALASLPLLTLGPRALGVRLGPRSVVLLAALFLGAGLGSLSIRAYEESGVLGESSLFLAILFGVAALIAGAAWLVNRRGTGWRDLLPGLMLGGCNALANLALVAALHELPGTVVFPFYSAIGLVFIAGFARLVWRERISRLETAGIALAVVAVACINL